MKTNAALLFAGTASATFSGWTDAPTFKTPSNNNNQCTSQEQTGFDWSNLNPGSFSSYDSYSFSGFQCTSSLGKRDTLTKRTFGSKVIQGSMKAGSGPSLSCGDDKDFSIEEYQISVSKDTDVEFHYKMEDGSTCKQTSPCQSGGTIVKNSQCGGAKEVQFQLPQGSEDDCDIGIHSIGFDCNPPASAPPPRASSSSTLFSLVPDVPASVPTSSPADPTSSASLSTSNRLVPDVPLTSTPVSPVPSSSRTRVPRPDVPTSSLSTAKISSSSSSSAPALSSSGGLLPNVPASSSSSSFSSLSPSVSSTKPDVPVTTAPCPDVVPQCLNTWIGLTGCKDNSDHQCYCAKADFTKNVIDCITARGADDSEVQKALTYLVGICAAHVSQNPGLITDCPKSISLTAAANPPASTPAPILPDQPAPIAITVTGIVTTSFSINQTITALGSTTVLQAPLISTITMTSTRTIPCSKCAAGTPSAAAASGPILPDVPQAAVPVTTITIAQSYTVPCTYSTGVSVGFPIPSSSTVTMLNTAVTVPQVAFTILPAVGTATAPAVGLAPASVVSVAPDVAASVVSVAPNVAASVVSVAPNVAASAASVAPNVAASVASVAPNVAASAVSVAPDVFQPAAATSGLLNASAAALSTGFGTTYVPTSTKTGGPLQVTTNAGVKVGGSVGGMIVGAVVAVLAL